MIIKIDAKNSNERVISFSGETVLKKESKSPRSPEFKITIIETKPNDEDPNIQFVRNEIESKLGLNVKIINKKNNSGKVIIEYKSLDQFDLISKKLRK